MRKKLDRDKVRARRVEAKRGWDVGGATDGDTRARVYRTKSLTVPLNI